MVRLQGTCPFGKLCLFYCPPRDGPFDANGDAAQVLFTRDFGTSSTDCGDSARAHEPARGRVPLRRERLTASTCSPWSHTKQGLDGEAASNLGGGESARTTDRDTGFSGIDSMADSYLEGPYSADWNSFPHEHSAPADHHSHAPSSVHGHHHAHHTSTHPATAPTLITPTRPRLPTLPMGTITLTTPQPTPATTPTPTTPITPTTPTTPALVVPSVIIGKATVTATHTCITATAPACLQE